MRIFSVFIFMFFSFSTYAGSGVGIPVHGTICNGVIKGQSGFLNSQIVLERDFDERFYELTFFLTGDSLSKKNERCRVSLPQVGKTKSLLMVCDHDLNPETEINYSAVVYSRTSASFLVKRESRKSLTTYDLSLNENSSKLFLKASLTLNTVRLDFQGELICKE